MALRILKEFLENSTIHGLVHISTAKSRASRAAWVAIVVACFAFAIHMIASSYEEWQESPVSTTITTHPITDLEFPAVTVCPPWGSNTAVNHLLRKVKHVNFTAEQRQKLLYVAKEVFIEIPTKKKIVPDSPCLNDNQILNIISKAEYDIGLTLDLTPWIDDDVMMVTALLTALRDCPEHLIESAKMFFFFENLIKHYSLQTLIASTMNNIAPRADKKIKDFSSVNMWYRRLDEIFDFELGSALEAFSTSTQQMWMKISNPPFMMEEMNERKSLPRLSGYNIFKRIFSLSRPK